MSSQAKPFVNVCLQSVSLSRTAFSYRSRHAFPHVPDYKISISKISLRLHFRTLPFLCSSKNYSCYFCSIDGPSVIPHAGDQRSGSNFVRSTSHTLFHISSAFQSVASAHLLYNVMNIFYMVDVCFVARDDDRYKM